MINNITIDNIFTDVIEVNGFSEEPSFEFLGEVLHIDSERTPDYLLKLGLIESASEDYPEATAIFNYEVRKATAGDLCLLESQIDKEYVVASGKAYRKSID